MRRHPLKLVLPLGMLGFIFLSCQTVDPPPGESILILKLADSLSKYETVTVTLIDPLDTTRVLERIWSGPLPQPSQLSAHPLKEAKDKNFIVKVAGYASDNQLLLQTLIYWVDKKKSVIHAPVPPYKPRYNLRTIKPSAGNLTPRFQPDSTQYRLIAPEKATSLKLTLDAEFTGAKVLINGKAVVSGSGTDPIELGTKADTLKVQVTDSSQGFAYTQEYRIIVIPTLPSKARLASLKPSIGEFRPFFHPDSVSYSLYIPDTTTSVTLIPVSNDPGGIQMYMDSQRVFEGIPSPPNFISAKGPGAIALEIKRGEESIYYVIYMQFGTPPP